MWGGYSANPGMMGYGYGNGWWMALHGVVWLVLLIVVVIAAVALVRYLWRIGSHGGVASGAAETSGAALRILEERYARGEIDREEFLQRKRDLG